MDFEQENERFEQYLSSHHIWVLATGSHDEISARSMSIITIGPKIYFQTDAGFEKTRHITENPNVALCCGNYQVKGTARILGLTIDEKNVPVMDLYKKVHPSSYERYSRKKDSFLIEVKPTHIQIWDYINGEPFITRLDLVTQTAEIQKYETWSESYGS